MCLSAQFCRMSAFSGRYAKDTAFCMFNSYTVVFYMAISEGFQGHIRGTWLSKVDDNQR